MTDTIQERPARSVPGAFPAILAVLLLLGGIALLILALTSADVPLTVLAGLLLVIAVTLAAGLRLVEPNQPKVQQFLGSSYAGTIREPGLHLVNPLNGSTSISTRVRNHETAMAKVNDADGNPIQISAIVVWRVADTAAARFSVNDFQEFVEVQAEAAVRHIAGNYPYDSADRISLRENADEITGKLTEEIAARVEPAGVEIRESRINNLAYAPEIAHAMLRRQQAGAVLAARKLIVQGAVGLVEQAISQLEADDIVDLDPERKAAMVSNLLVVLCGDSNAQPVVNTGTLYQ